MATESELRDLLRGPDPEGRAAIDLDAVLTRARRRRRPKVVVAQALGSVAAVGVLVTGVVVTLPQAGPASLLVAEDAAGGSAEEGATTPYDGDANALRMPAEACGETYVALDPMSGWSLELAPATVDVEAPLTVPVTVRNVGEEPASAIVSPPRIVITQDGVVVGYSPAVDTAGIRVELAAGAETSLDATVEPIACDPADPSAPVDELAVLPPGQYEMRPVMLLSDDAGMPSTLAGPPQSLLIG